MAVKNKQLSGDSEVITKNDNQDVEKNKNIACLSYLWILCFVPLLTRKRSKFVQFHAKQGLVLFLASFLIIFPILGWLLFLGLVIISTLAFTRSYNGEWWKLPFIYEVSKKIKL